MARNRGAPHYQRIMAALLDRLSQPAELGGRLPSERALAARFHVARNTVARAFRELRGRGLLTRIQGSGTYRRPGACPVILGLVYNVASSPYDRFCEGLQSSLARAGYSLAMRDTGANAGKLPGIFADPILARVRAVIWLAPSYPAALAGAAAHRPQLPPDLPLVLVNDPLGCSLHTQPPADLVHFDHAEAARQLVECLAAAGYRHPLLIRRTNLDARYSSDQIRLGFEGQLTARGIPNAPGHVVAWNPENPGELRDRLRTGRSARGGRADAIILPWFFNLAFLRHCQAMGCPIPPRVPVVGFGQTQGRFRLPADYRRLAEVCAELLLSRLRRPARGNLHVLVPMPVIVHQD